MDRSTSSSWRPAARLADGASTTLRQPARSPQRNANATTKRTGCSGCRCRAPQRSRSGRHHSNSACARLRSAVVTDTLPRARFPTTTTTARTRTCAPHWRQRSCPSLVEGAKKLGSQRRVVHVDGRRPVVQLAHGLRAASIVRKKVTIPALRSRRRAPGSLGRPPIPRPCACPQHTPRTQPGHQLQTPQTTMLPSPARVETGGTGHRRLVGVRACGTLDMPHAPCSHNTSAEQCSDGLACRTPGG